MSRVIELVPILVDRSGPLRIKVNSFALDHHGNLSMDVTVENQDKDKAVPGFITYVGGNDSWGQGTRRFPLSVQPGESKQVPAQFRSDEWQSSSPVFIWVEVMSD